jgi:hypothetical protein
MRDGLQSEKKGLIILMVDQDSFATRGRASQIVRRNIISASAASRCVARRRWQSKEMLYFRGFVMSVWGSQEAERATSREADRTLNSSSSKIDS